MRTSANAACVLTNFVRRPLRRQSTGRDVPAASPTVHSTGCSRVQPLATWLTPMPLPAAIRFPAAGLPVLAAAARRAESGTVRPPRRRCSAPPPSGASRSCSARCRSSRERLAEPRRLQALGPALIHADVLLRQTNRLGHKSARLADVNGHRQTVARAQLRRRRAAGRDSRGRRRAVGRRSATSRRSTRPAPAPPKRRVAAGVRIVARHDRRLQEVVGLHRVPQSRRPAAAVRVLAASNDASIPPEFQLVLRGFVWWRDHRQRSRVGRVVDLPREQPARATAASGRARSLATRS